MKEYMQPEVELVQFVSESVAMGPATGVGSAESNNFSPSEIVVP